MVAGKRTTARRLLFHLAGIPALLLASQLGPARAQQADATASAAPATPTYGRLATVAIPGNPLTVFDISYVDPFLPLYYLADRSNAGVDVVDVVNNRYLTRVGGFVGVRNGANGQPSTAVSGPNGVQPVGVGELWAGDGDSTVKVIDLAKQEVVATISTVRTDEPGHTADTDKRVDEMSYDPRDRIIAVANNAASPPFVTFISTRAPDRAVLGRIVFSDYAGVEQSVYNPRTGLFYVNLTARNDDPDTGGVAVVDPRTLGVLRVFPVAGCEPSGLALGPRQNLLVGCARTDNTQVVSARTGEVQAVITEVAGEDEVWFNPGDRNYYLSARNNPASKGGPVLGIVSSRTDAVVATVPTDPGAHSVAADWRTNRIFVPLSPNAADPACATVCIGVFGRTDAGAQSSGVNEAFVQRWLSSAE